VGGFCRGDAAVRTEWPPRLELIALHARRRGSPNRRVAAVRVRGVAGLRVRLRFGRVSAGLRRTEHARNRIGWTATMLTGSSDSGVRLVTRCRPCLDCTWGVALDQLMVGPAVLSLLSKVAESRRLTRIVDDARWLERAAARAVVLRLTR